MTGPSNRPIASRDGGAQERTCVMLGFGGLPLTLPRSFQIGDDLCHFEIHGQPVHLRWEDEHHMVVITSCVYDGCQHEWICAIEGPDPIAGDPMYQRVRLHDGFRVEHKIFESMPGLAAEAPEGPDDATGCRCHE
jgi:hypothetical protein